MWEKLPHESGALFFRRDVSQLNCDVRSRSNSTYWHIHGLSRTRYRNLKMLVCWVSIGVSPAYIGAQTGFRKQSWKKEVQHAGTYINCWNWRNSIYSNRTGDSACGEQCQESGVTIVSVSVAHNDHMLQTAVLSKYIVLIWKPLSWKF